MIRSVVLHSVLLHVAGLVCLAGEVQVGTPASVRHVLTMDMGWSLCGATHVVVCEHMVARWQAGRAYEKLAIADGLLKVLEARETDYIKLQDYTWRPGEDDLSLTAGRAKWGIERLLGVRLPGKITRRTSSRELSKLRARAAAAVDAYRSGMKQRCAEDHVSPPELARLRDKYHGKLTTECSKEAEESGWMMDDFLGEWSPVGRKYEDMVTIIGLRGEWRDGRVYYKFVGDFTGSHYYFRVKNGTILSVGMLTGD